ncbi:hypothetical protein [Candidatus Formimonas warabiya]|uniref:Oxidoreductase molybdopterin-binding domain-containing protein n=1 Tax=Formimonas warabiya TaxID=1761012 RepID=A0A3G1KR26_FORW1|nr:hypothetical protein [Candidatus Formimonas warabiya]ATW24911.1 hypothetical protein DCMF_09125 [Candidatus Formimonas warabiya]
MVLEAKRIGKENKILVLGVFLLILVIGVFSYLNRNPEDLKEGQILFKAGNTKLSVMTVDDLKKLPSVEKKMTVRTSRGDEEHLYTMTPLRGVLEAIDPKLTEEYEKIIARGIDGYTSGVTMSEVLEPDNVYLAYLDQGRPLPAQKVGAGTESVQVIICRDQFGQRFVKFLVSMEVEN